MFNLLKKIEDLVLIIILLNKILQRDLYLIKQIKKIKSKQLNKKIIIYKMLKKIFLKLWTV